MGHMSICRKKNVRQRLFATFQKSHDYCRMQKQPSHTKLLTVHSIFSTLSCVHTSLSLSKTDNCFKRVASGQALVANDLGDDLKCTTSVS